MTTEKFIILNYIFLTFKRGSSHGTLDTHPMRIGDPDSKTALPPHDLDSDPSYVLCCVTVREIHSSSAMRVVCVPCGALRETTLNPDPGSGSSESVFSARLESPVLICHYVAQFYQRSLLIIVLLVTSKVCLKCMIPHYKIHPTMIGIGYLLVIYFNKGYFTFICP